MSGYIARYLQSPGDGDRCAAVRLADPQEGFYKLNYTLSSISSSMASESLFGSFLT